MSILGGFYIYRVDPSTIQIKDATDQNTQEPEITGIVLFKDVGYNSESHIIFGYFPIPSKLLLGKSSTEDLAAFNSIRDFITPDKKNYNISSDKGLFDYHPENLAEFIKKCYIPPLSS